MSQREPDYEEMQDIIRGQIASSPIVAHCTGLGEGCGNEIRQAEVDYGVADRQTCSSCILNYAASVM